MTADALHCQRATADYLHGRGADFVVQAEDNQPRLFARRHQPGHHPRQPPAIASLVRGQQATGSLHWLRDTLYRDNSTVRTRSGPRAMATLRNLAVGALHLAGRHDATEGGAAIRKLDSTRSDAR